MTREIEVLIASLTCRPGKGGCGKPIMIVSDPPIRARGPRQKRMRALHSQEANGQTPPQQIGGKALVYKLRGILEDRCAAQKESVL